METIVALGTASLALGAVVSATLARRHAALWSGPRAMALSPGRRHAPAGAPWGLALAATFSVALGVMTLVMFAPLGTVLALLYLGDGDTLAGLGLAAVTASGFAIAAALIRSAGALYRREGGALATTARRSALHHGAVFALFAWLDGGLAVLVAIPCAAGALLAVALLHYRRPG